MLIFNILLFFISLYAVEPAHAEQMMAARIQPSIALEKKIAYQQGQFAALYRRCGSKDDRKVIGGSVKVWREKTFANYNGTAEELHQLEDSFNRAVLEVDADLNACVVWEKQAAATMRGIIQLAQYGAPVQLKQLEQPR